VSKVLFNTLFVFTFLWGLVADLIMSSSDMTPSDLPLGSLNERIVNIVAILLINSFDFQFQNLRTRFHQLR